MRLAKGMAAGAGLLAAAGALAIARQHGFLGGSGESVVAEGIQVVSGGQQMFAGTSPASTSMAAASGPCVSGTWRAFPGGMPVQRESAHFVVRYNSGTMTAAQAQRATTVFEHIWDELVTRVGFVQPSCSTADKIKVNLNFIPNVGPTGSLDENGNPAMWIAPEVLDDIPTMAHEFTHSLQGGSGGFRDSPYVGWFWENHAEFMAAQMPEVKPTFSGCTEAKVFYPHFAWDYTPHRYCAWLFLEYLKNRYGFAVVNDLWTKSPRIGDQAHNGTDVLSVLMKNMNWTQAQLNTVFADYAMHNVNFDFTNPDGTDQGKTFRAAFGPNDDVADYKRLRTATLDPIDVGARRFSILPAQAPQRLGYNLVQLFPDAGSSTVSVRFRGIVQSQPATNSFPGLINEPSTVDQPSSGWRWGLVAVGSDGKSRYSSISASADATLSLAVRSNDKSVWLVVVGAPTQNFKSIWDQAYYSVYRYPWMAQFTNAMPSGFQPNAPTPTASGRRHPNGGGWVAAGANVASTAFVGPYAKVLGGTVSGNARVEDHAIVQDGLVTGKAVVGGLSLITEGSTIKDSAQVATVWEGIRASTVGGTAKNLGNNNYYAMTMSKGVFYGNFETQEQFSEAQRGANRTTAVPEVTAKPNYVW